MQRVQQRRQRENRQETERLKSLVAAYRSLAGSFSSASQEHNSQIEETLADIVPFGSLGQVELAVRCAAGLKRGESVDYQPLIEALRLDLPLRSGRGEGEGGRGEARGGGGGGGAAAGAGGLGAGLIVADIGSERDPP